MSEPTWGEVKAACAEHVAQLIRWDLEHATEPMRELFDRFGIAPVTAVMKQRARGLDRYADRTWPDEPSDRYEDLDPEGPAHVREEPQPTDQGRV